MNREPDAVTAFRHEALLYAGEPEFVQRLTRFLRDGVKAGEPSLVVVSVRKIDLLRRRLGEDANKVEFADMDMVGANPACIIPAWKEFVDRTVGQGRRLRGIGEPIFPARSADELVECQRHEALLNLAFAGAPAWWLLCPYDVSLLAPAVIDEARRSHPFVADGGEHRASAAYAGQERVSSRFDIPFPEPADPGAQISFDAHSLSWVRRIISRAAASAGLTTRRIADLVTAANEVATNSVAHGGGGGMVRVWPVPHGVVCEIRDQGHIAKPLADRTEPGSQPDSPRGLWLANQLCDLVQVRSLPGGTVVRLHQQA